MLRLRNLPILILLLNGCIKSKVTINDVINPIHFSSRQILADGTTLVTVTATINVSADSARRMVQFTTSSGSFLGGKDSTITKNATFVNKQLITQVQLKAPMKPGWIVIKAQVNLTNDKQGFIQTDSIMAIPSVPAKLLLSANSFAVKVNYGSEVTITGLLTNSLSNPVSVGNNVVFNDHYDDNTPVDGRFRAEKTSSDSTSTVSAIYSPGLVPTGKNIWVVCYVLDSSGNRTSIKDSVLINTISN